MYHFSTNPFYILSPTPFLLVLCFLSFAHSKTIIPYYNSLVYKSCSNQSSSLSQTTFPSLFQQLVSHSSNTNFFKTSQPDNGLSGLFQCRGDLSTDDCHSCVSSIPKMASNLCGQDSMAGRIQLSGCYLHYQTNDDHDDEGDPGQQPKLRYKTCSVSKTEETEQVVRFREMMNEAFAALEAGVAANGNGFFATNYELLVRVLAQCEGDLGGCDCGECVSNGVEIALDECENSVYGEIYMDHCLISFAYHESGIPNDFYPERRKEKNENSSNAGIVVGGAAALSFGLIFLLFIKSYTKKDDDEDADEDFICNTDDESSNMNHPPNKKKNLSIDKKRAVFEMLVKEQQDGRLAKGVSSKVATLFFISNKSVSRIWHEGKFFSTTNSDLRFSSKLLNRRHRQRIGICFEQMKDIPLRRRTNIRSLSNALNMSKSTLHRRIKEGNIRPHSNPIKPYLSNDNKKARLEFCLSMIVEGTIASRPTFINMHNRIHIDEKWFYMSKTSNKYYLHLDESDPLRTCKSKRFITKIMFLAAVARPRFDAITNEEFDGKIGIWPFVSHEPAKRSSKNRVVGTLETKPIASRTKDVIRLCIVKNLLPSIKVKWPSSCSRTIFIQQDNAKPHLDIDDVEFLEAARYNGFDIRLCCKPPNSPDMNVLDLGFFRAIDSLQHQESPSTIEEFVLAVEMLLANFQPNI